MRHKRTLEGVAYTRLTASGACGSVLIVLSLLYSFSASAVLEPDPQSLQDQDHQEIAGHGHADGDRKTGIEVEAAA
jgi:hypothetical protein